MKHTWHIQKRALPPKDVEWEAGGGGVFEYLSRCCSSIRASSWSLLVWPLIGAFLRAPLGSRYASPSVSAPDPRTLLLVALAVFNGARYFVIMTIPRWSRGSLDPSNPSSELPSYCFLRPHTCIGDIPNMGLGTVWEYKDLKLRTPNLTLREMLVPGFTCHLCIPPSGKHEVHDCSLNFILLCKISPFLGYFYKAWNRNIHTHTWRICEPLLTSHVITGRSFTYITLVGVCIHCLLPLVFRIACSSRLLTEPGRSGCIIA